MTPMDESMSSEASQYYYVKWYNVPLMITHMTVVSIDLYLKLKTLDFFLNAYQFASDIGSSTGSYGLTSQRQQSGTHS